MDGRMDGRWSVAGGRVVGLQGAKVDPIQEKAIKTAGE